MHPRSAGSRWLNSGPLGPAEPRNTLLMDFQTLTCIN